MIEKIIPDEILEKMTLSNIYKILNENIFPFLSTEEKQFVEDLEEFCINLDPQIDYEKEVLKSKSLLQTHVDRDFDARKEIVAKMERGEQVRIM